MTPYPFDGIWPTQPDWDHLCGGIDFPKIQCQGISWCGTNFNTLEFVNTYTNKLYADDAEKGITAIKSFMTDYPVFKDPWSDQP